ncbi:MAG: hypothetical protein AAGB32_01125 [Pseudomonadota bacterium]
MAREFVTSLNIGDVISFRKWVVQWAEKRGSARVAQIRAPLPYYEDRKAAELADTLDFVRQAGLEHTMFRPGVTREREAQLELEWTARVTRTAQETRADPQGKYFLVTAVNGTFMNSEPYQEPFTDPKRGYNFYQAIETSRFRKTRPTAQPLTVIFELPIKQLQTNLHMYRGINRKSEMTIGPIR